MIDNVAVFGLSKLLGVRRSFNSQGESDSSYIVDMREATSNEFRTLEQVSIGPKDLQLLRKLVLNGDSHGKTTRFVDVYFTLTLPRRVWVDFDTYRLGVVKEIRPDDIEYMSDSTMHTIHRGVTVDDFDQYTTVENINRVKELIAIYKQDPSEYNFLRMKSNLPEGFIQARDLKTNYQTLRHIYFDRRKHRQPEFKDFCKWVESLPYAKYLITCEEKSC